MKKCHYFLLISGIYLTLIMAMTATSILICVLVLNLHYRDPSAPVPNWLRNLAYNVMAPLVCTKNRAKKKGQTVYQLCEFTRDYAIGTALNNDSHNEFHTTNLDSSTTPLHHTSSLEDNGINDQVMYLLRSGRKKVMLEEVVQHLRKITFKTKEKDEQETLKAEWKNVAKILDRFFLMVFVFLVVISSVVLLYFYPMSARYRNEIRIFENNG